MGLFRRRGKLAPPNVTAGWDAGDDWYTWEAPRNLVRGESHYRPALRRLTGQPREHGYLIPVCVDFVREPTNPHDRNAFRAEVAGEHVGYLARHIAAQLAGPADRARCASFSVCGLLRGGSLDAPDIGVHVWLGRRLTPAIVMRFADTGSEVAWPPLEGPICSADQP